MLGEWDHDTWRNALTQAGFYVQRHKLTVLEHPLWMKKKGYLSHCHTVQGVLTHIIIASKSRNGFRAKDPFGTHAHTHTHP